MIKELIIASLLISILFIGPARADPIELQSQEIGGWSITAWSEEDDSSKFSHCTATTYYFAKNAKVAREMKTEALSFILKINREKMGIVYVGKDWKLVQGNTYNVEWIFTDGETYNIDTIATSNEIISGTSPPHAAWTKSFMESNGVEILINGKSIGSYQLNNSRLATKLVFDCVAHWYSKMGDTLPETFSEPDTFPSNGTFE